MCWRAAKRGSSWSNRDKTDFGIAKCKSFKKERRSKMEVKKPNGSGNGNKGSNEWRVKVGLAEMLKGGVIMDVTNAEQAKIAENAGACAVMALERVPSDIRKEGGVARMASIKVIREIMKTVTIP